MRNHPHLEYLFLAGLLSVAPAFAQANPPPQATAPTAAAAREDAAAGHNANPPQLLTRDSAKARAEQRQMTVDVQVLNHDGRPVDGLQAGDFTLLDNLEPVKILSFSGHEHDAETEVVYVIDALSCNFEELARARDQIGKALRSDGGRLGHMTSVLWLTRSKTPVKRQIAGVAVRPLAHNEAYLQAAPESRNGLLLAQDLDRSVIAISGELAMQRRYGDVDRLRLAARALNMLADAEGHRPGRKMVIWISPTWPLLTQIDRSARHQLFNYIVQTYSALHQARITLYTIDPQGVAVLETSAEPGLQSVDKTMARLQAYVKSGLTISETQTASYSSYLKAPESERQAEANDLSLQVLAARTGGRVLALNNDIAGQIAQCLAAAESFYSLTYQTVTARHADEYHALGVRVDKPGVQVLARAGYYAQP